MMYGHEYGLSDEQALIQSTVRKFVKNEILPVESRLDPDATEFPEGQMRRLREKTRAMGMFSPWAPREYGGAGLDFLTETILMEEISKHRQGLYNPGGGAFGYAVNPILYAGTEVLARVLPQPHPRQWGATPEEPRPAVDGRGPSGPCAELDLFPGWPH